MKLFSIASIILWASMFLEAQPNCKVFLWKGDTAQYQACKLLEENIGKYNQFSKEFHALVDSAIEICPRFAYAYREKAAPFVKSGQFIEWKKYIDLAVKYDTLGYLPVRASLRYKFFADYTGTLEDIGLLEQKVKGNIGYSSNGTYHLLVVKALCLKQSGDQAKGIQVLEAWVNNKVYTPGLYDYLHLGVMYLEAGDYKKAEHYLLLQNNKYDYAETYYYLSLLTGKINQMDKMKSYKERATNLFLKNQKLNDPYNNLIDQIDLRQLK